MAPSTIRNLISLMLLALTFTPLTRAVTCTPEYLIFSLIQSDNNQTKIQVSWLAEQACTHQKLKYKRAEDYGFTEIYANAEPSKILWNGNPLHIHKASFDIEGDNYLIKCGYGSVWTKVYIIKVPTSNFKCFVLGGFTIKDSESRIMLDRIRHDIMKNREPSIVMDISSDKGIYERGPEYYAMLEPVLEFSLYVRIQEEIPYLSFPAATFFFSNDEKLKSKENNETRVAFVNGEILDEETMAQKNKEYYNENKIDLVVGSQPSLYMRIGEAAPTFVVTGKGSSKAAYNKVPKINPQATYTKSGSYGRLRVFNSTYSIYEQFSNEEGKVIDTFVVVGKLNQGKAQAGSSTERIIALIIIFCSLSFLGYFIYSMVSCYTKKPNVRERKKYEERSETQELRHYV